MSEWEKYLVTGLPVPEGPVPVRKEINDLTDEEIFLYLEGLRKFKTIEREDPLSYYQIAGIHGLPYTTWPDKPWNKDIKQVYDPKYRDPITKLPMFGGFCTHSSVLFLSWHRPYLSLFETQLYKCVNEVADAILPETADKAAYQKLARSFRIPYWDWARKDVHHYHFPRLALSEARIPPYRTGFKQPAYEGQPALGEVTNPLYRYRFPEGTLEDLKQLSVKDKDDNVIVRDYDSTQRYIKAVGESQGEEAGPEFDKFFKDQSVDKFGTKQPWPIDKLPPGIRPKERNLSERVAYIMKAYKRYGPMSYNTKPNNPEDKPDINKAEVWGSLEDIHNAVHVLSGMGGHMNLVPKSAYDPIFWLHHANIDRLMTIWQALHESEDASTYVEKRPVPAYSFAKRDDSFEDQSTPLWPFRKTVQGDNPWWTSSQVKRTETFGYAYPETLGWKWPGTPKARAKLTRKIDDMYTSLGKPITESVLGISTAGSDLFAQAALLKTLEGKKSTFSTQAEPMAQFDLFQEAREALPSTEELAELFTGEDKPFLKDLLTDDKYYEWLINVKVQKHAMGGQVQVHFFLGTPPPAEFPSIWGFTPYHVGTFAPLGQEASTACENCRQGQEAGLEVTGQIPLTLALTERYINGTIPDLGVANVVEYLRQNLHWRVVLSNGVTIDDQRDIAGLFVFVVSNEVTVSSDPDIPPVYADGVVIHPEATTRVDNTAQGLGNGTGLSMELYESYNMDA